MIFGAVALCCTAVSAQADNSEVPPAIQLKLLNGLTVDFDETTPTKIINKPENPAYDWQMAVSGNLDQLGPFPMGKGNIEPSLVDRVYLSQIIVTAKEMAPSPGVQYKWERWIKRRSWRIRKITNAGTGAQSWEVMVRTSRGTAPAQQPNGVEELAAGFPQLKNETPSATKKQFYCTDNTGDGYFGDDTLSNYLHTGDYIYHEKAFIYKVLYKFTGNTWTVAAALNVGQKITIRFKADGGGSGHTAVTDWEPVPDLAGGNSVTAATIDPTITEAKVRAIVGGTLPINIDSNANP